MHDSWDALLNNHVVAINHGHSTEVDYAAIKAKHSELKSYLDSLSAVTQNEFDMWEKPKQLAFLINAYNAFTVELILTKYPELKSIKDLGSFLAHRGAKSLCHYLVKRAALMI